VTKSKGLNAKATDARRVMAIFFGRIINTVASKSRYAR
jgi:hypothetical protein